MEKLCNDCKETKKIEEPVVEAAEETTDAAEAPKDAAVEKSTETPTEAPKDKTSSTE